MAEGKWPPAGTTRLWRVVFVRGDSPQFGPWVGDTDRPGYAPARAFTSGLSTSFGVTRGQQHCASQAVAHSPCALPLESFDIIHSDDFKRTSPFAEVRIGEGAVDLEGCVGQGRFCGVF